MGGSSEAAWLFPGQGSQRAGMGMDLLETEPAGRAVFEGAAEVLGWDVAGLCRDGSPEELKETRRAQPAILTVCLACDAVLREHGLEPGAVAGHSLGEYAALSGAGVLEQDETLRLVADRAGIMDRAAKEQPGAMSAILGLDSETVKDIVAGMAEQGTIVVANYNAPAQVVVSGDEQLVARCEKEMKEAGARRVVRLEVSGAFHSPMMEEASNEFAMVLAGIEFRPADVPVVSNATGRASRDPAVLKDSLLRQMAGPVLWEQSVAEVERLGFRAAVEVGPGNVLAGLTRRISPDLQVLSGGDTSSISEAVSVLGGCDGS